MTSEVYEDELIEKIKILNETIWEGRVKVPQIQKWLNNFKEDKEKLHALYLLSQFMYFGDLQIKELLKSLYRDLYKYPTIEKIRIENGKTLDRTIISTEFEIAEKQTRFVGIGNPSESGTHILYYFRQENKIAKDLFITDEAILRTDSSGVRVLVDPTVRHYVFMDDFCGSGEQAVGYAEIVNEIKGIDNSIKVSYLLLFATSLGKNEVKARTMFDYVECVVELDKSFRCFDSDSRYFQNHPPNIDRDFSEQFCAKYGAILMKDICKRLGHSEPYLSYAVDNVKLGWGDCQLLLGLKHNVPDNTLPIIWYGEDTVDWYPIFKRYNKKYQ